VCLNNNIKHGERHSLYSSCLGGYSRLTDNEALPSPWWRWRWQWRRRGGARRWCRWTRQECEGGRAEPWTRNLASTRCEGSGLCVKSPFSGDINRLGVSALEPEECHISPQRLSDQACGRRSCGQKHSLCVGWWNLFSSCAVVSVFCSGGK
jgi:hypothetical protein